MPVLIGKGSTESARETALEIRNIWDGRAETGGKLSKPLLPTCSNPGCNTSWLHLWRSRQAPIVEGGWTCSVACTTAVVRRTLRRELDGLGESPAVHRHRVPLGLILLDMGVITHTQLKTALELQRTAGGGRIGAWLMRACGVEERHITKALGLQWNRPVFGIESYQSDSVEGLIPRLILDTFGVLPLRMSGSRILYIAFEDRIDHCISLVLEKMTGLRVEAGIIGATDFARVQPDLLKSRFPRVRLLESLDGESMATSLVGLIESTSPVESRIARIRDLLWLRCWKPKHYSLHHGPGPNRLCVEDTLCCLTGFN